MRTQKTLHGIMLLPVMAMFVFSLMATAPEKAHAQLRRYSSPSGPTLSPNLNFFRQNTSGVLDLYNDIIRPERALRRSIAAQGQAIDTTSTELGQLQGQVSGLQVIIAPTGTGGRFFDYSHYYRFGAIARPPQ